MARRQGLVVRVGLALQHGQDISGLFPGAIGAIFGGLSALGANYLGAAGGALVACANEIAQAVVALGEPDAYYSSFCTITSINTFFGLLPTPNFTFQADIVLPY